jgi:transposase-like protein
VEKIKSLVEARKELSTQTKCEEYLARMRWPDGVVCPRCGAKHPTYLQSRRKWQCSCRYQFSVTSGTIFHKTHIDLPRWMLAIWLMCHSPKGISSKQVQREIGVTYKTAWYMAKRIRTAMRHDVFEDLLCGIIEVDDAVVRASGDGLPKGNVKFEGKNVLGVAERGGLLRMFTLEDLKAKSIKRVIAKNLGEVQEIYSDAASKLFFLAEFGRHETVAHAYDEYVLGDIHTNTIENAWSLFKRALIGVYHHVSAKWLQDYLDEFAFRYSHRHEKDKLMDLVLVSCSM